MEEIFGLILLILIFYNVYLAKKRGRSVGWILLGSVLLGVLPVTLFLLIAKDKKMAAAENREDKFNGNIMYGKVLWIGVMLDGHMSDREKMTMVNWLDLGKKDEFKQVWSEEESNEIPDRIGQDTKLMEICEVLGGISKFEDITSELENYFSDLGGIDVLIEKADREADGTVNNFLKAHTLSVLLILLGNDNELDDKEIAYYNFVANKLGISDSRAEEKLSGMADIIREEELEVLNKIPTLSGKVIEYIIDEYPSFKELAKMSPEEMKDNIPGVTKPAANALLKQLSRLYEIDTEGFDDTDALIEDSLEKRN